MVRCVAGQYDVAVIEQFVATVVKANVWFRQERNKTLCDFKRCRHVACMVKSTARPAVKRVASRMHSAHVVSTGGHGNLGFANRADQRVIDVNVDNELAIQRAPRSHNGRFLRHRILSEGKKRRNTKQFTKKNRGCQRGGVHGVANQYATTERANGASQLMLQRRSRGLA